MAYAGGGEVGGPPSKDDPIKSSFLTREGTYKLMTLSEYSRPNRVPLNPQAGNTMTSAPVRVSFLTLREPAAQMTIGSSRHDSPVHNAHNPPPPPSRPQPPPAAHHPPPSFRDRFEESEMSTYGEYGDEEPSLVGCPDRICFNVGRELYVYHYRGVRSAADLSKPIDKRVYKGTYPTCHDFNSETAEAGSCSLLIGFSAGQIQLIDPFQKNAAISRLFNEDRLIDKTRLTGLAWIPGTLPNPLVLTQKNAAISRLFNEDRLIDKTRLTGLAWIPGTLPNPLVLTQKNAAISRLFNEDRLIDKTRLTGLAWIPGTLPNPLVLTQKNAAISRLFNEDRLIDKTRLTGLAWIPGTLPNPLVLTQKNAAISRLFNEDRLIDKTRLTGLAWIPGSPKQFLAAHASGQLYVYNEDLPCGPGPPTYQVFKSGNGYSVYTCKTKSSRNPTFRWAIGEGPLHDFRFSPDAKLLATCSQDGFLRVFNYHSMELVGEMRSYFGGLLSLGWSPDGKYLVTGGEDDLVSVYALSERRVVCRGQGHRSWISQVAFDPYTTTSDPLPVDLGSEEDLRPPPTSFPFPSSQRAILRRGQKASVSSASLGSVCYRFGSVGHDTQLCLWDLTEDVLKQPGQRHRASVIFPLSPGGNIPATNSDATSLARSDASEGPNSVAPPPPVVEGKKHKRGFSFGTRLGSEKKGEGKAKEAKEEGVKPESAIRVLGTPVCPRLDEVPLIEPLVCKKIAHERLTTLAFREDCIVTACQEGFICTWARPGKAGLSHQQSINSPNPGGSPNLLPGGTIV